MPSPRSDATVDPAARFESFLPSSPRIRPWWTYSGGPGSERLVKLPVEVLVRPVVVAAVDVGDAEVDVVDHARQVVGRSSVLAEQRRPAEPLPAELRCRLPVALLAPALPRPGLHPTRGRATPGRRRIASSPPATFRVGSVSSIRRSIQSPSRRLITALSALPTWSEPVGLGAKRTLFIAPMNLAAARSRAGRPLRVRGQPSGGRGTEVN